MGALLGLCTPAGGPCGADEEDLKPRSKRPPRHGNMDSVNSHSENSPLYDNDEDSGDSVEDDGTVHYREEDSLSEQSRLLPHKEMPIPSFIARHVMTNKMFRQAKQRCISQISRLSDIEKVEIKGNNWWLQGTDTIALDNTLDSHKDLMDIVIWRIPIIPAFSYFESDEEFYDLVFDATSPAFVDVDGIWALLSKDRFNQVFGAKLLDDVKVMNDEQHQYLVHDQQFPQHSGEFQELVVKLQKIEETKKTNELIIIGQRIAVKDLLRAVRQKEVMHQSIQTHLRDDWEVHPDDADAPKPHLITNHCVTITNLPKRCNEQEIEEEVLGGFGRWSYVTMLEEDAKEEESEEGMLKALDPPQGTPVSPLQIDEDSTPKKASKKFKFAKISFDTKAAMDVFVDAVNGDEGIHIRANRISLTNQRKEEKERHLRLLHDGIMIA